MNVNDEVGPRGNIRGRMSSSLSWFLDRRKRTMEKWTSTHTRRRTAKVDKDEQEARLH